MGKWYCNNCVESYYCNATFGPVISYGTYICPEGFYCPNGTEYAEQFPCPRGTFNNRTGRVLSLFIFILINAFAMLRPKENFFHHYASLLFLLSKNDYPKHHICIVRLDVILLYSLSNM